ncbi:MAG: quinolinate synthase NadA [Candidatus Eisenbacteria bacterium]|nr:quinolinate synthase NadA [Candidatus Eisenbacteria bacterium]
MASMSSEIDPGLDIHGEIERLRKEKNAVILAHYYQEGEIQDIADRVGDSLALAQAAEKTEARVIVFAGVHFMAETAKILNPDRLVVVPDLEAGCSLADGCPPEAFQAFLSRYPDHFVVSYINCSAAVKGMSDIICTSSNAEKIVRSVPEGQGIVFAPDQHLGRYIMSRTGRPMILWPGSCEVHELFSERKIVQLKLRHPAAQIVAHPECEESVLRHADHIGSTSSILKFVVEDAGEVYIIATEPGIIHQMEKMAPGKTYIPAPPDSSCACNECPHMRLNTLEKLYLCLRDGRPEIRLDEEIRKRALVPIRRMLALS